MAVLRDLLLFYCLLWRTTGQLDVVVGPEEDAVLQCQSPAEGKISVLKWSRPNRNSDGYVYFYRNNRCFHSYQHPRFHGRVELRRPDMKNGDATLILRNVTEQDAGIYECYTSVKNLERSKRSSVETSQFINLTVTGETRQTAEKLEFIVEEPEGNPQDAVTVGTSVPLVAVVVVVAVVAFVCVLGFVSLWKVKRRKQQSVQNHSDSEEESMFPGKA
ncbi:coxsackievirus and adenovirus receptor homolog [Acanthochromis polyacanthus]|uniref:coxsackievirus and adenovirus receptor homolog n=1 Tax=Acanthochromis polyacanthus TaxID=80966 RepID=UPI0022347FD2|nr:coxsackievirus and adenovirus receptor homolog [Acanthochromis polyacanthus]